MNELATTNPTPETDGSEQPDFRRTLRRPLLGPALWIFGAVLWAYVVMGELVVRADRAIVEAVAVFVVLATLVITWWSATGNFPAGKWQVVRVLPPGLIAIVLFIVSPVVVAKILRPSGASAFHALTVILWLLGFIAFLLGRALTLGKRPRQTRHGRARAVVLWFLPAVATVSALLSAMLQV